MAYVEQWTALFENNAISGLILSRDSNLSIYNITADRNIMIDLKSLNKRVLATTCRSLLGRRNFVRFSRFLWLQARLDAANDFYNNGESSVQDALIEYQRNRGFGDVFDVGANIGNWSACLLEKYANSMPGRLFMFEPSPGSRAVIEQNLEAQLQDDDVILEAIALTNESKTAIFHIVGSTAGTNSLQNISNDKQVEEIEVECRTIDDFIAENDIAHLTFVKVDTEGNDYNVIEGATQMMRERKVDFIQFEYNYRWVAFRYFLKDVFELVEPLGYSVGKLTSEGIEEYDAWHFELETYREGNYLIYRRSNRLPMKHFKWWNADS